MHSKCSFVVFFIPICKTVFVCATYNLRLFWNLFESIKYSGKFFISLVYTKVVCCFNVSTEKRFIKVILLIRIVIELPRLYNTEIMVNKWNDEKKNTWRNTKDTQQESRCYRQLWTMKKKRFYRHRAKE